MLTVKSDLLGKFFKPLLVVYTIVYLLGIFGLSNSATYPFFVKATEFVLLLTFIGTFLFHTFQPNLKSNFIAFSLILFISLAVEIIGVNYGIPFGPYYYGKSLGLKVFSTPIVIGFNWLFIGYSTSSIFFNYKINPILKILLASVLMVIYDLLLEINAPHLDMWYFANNKPPVQNYIAWFFIALIIHSIFRIFKINTKNKLAPYLFLIQFVFHLVLAIVGLGND